LSGETRKTRILLADGQRVVRRGIRKLLEQQADFEVVGETDNGPEVVKLTRELKPDLTIMEARMPGLDSVQIIKRIKAESPEVAVLILTSFDEEENVLELLKAGVGGYLLKSAREDDLVQAIRFIKAGQFVADPVVEQRLLKRAVRPGATALDYGQHLTRRETEVLGLAARGLNNRDIAYELGLSEGTIKGYFVNIFGKMGVKSRTEAVMEAIRRGWVTPEDG
jgi:DNA-binding NarL/FixJ family response regulator